MKKLLVLLCLMAISQFANAQFTLTPKGLDNGTESDYIVWVFDGSTQQELFKAVHQFMGANYVSPQNVISTSGEDQITINGIQREVIEGNKQLGRTFMFDINYTIVILFKDNKIRINNPSINELSRIVTIGKITMDLVGNYSMVSGYSSIFSEKGKLYLPQTKKSVELFFNDYLQKLKVSIQNKENSEW